MKKKAARMGRPPLPAGQARAGVFTMRVSAEERAAIATAAARSKLPVTQWAREALIAATRTS